MRLPNGGRAILDVRKLTDYCLSLDHVRGRNKARVFAEALAIGRNEANELREILLFGAKNMEANLLGSDIWGERWQVDIPVARHGKRAVVRSLWIVRSGESVSRFISCWVI